MSLVIFVVCFVPNPIVVSWGDIFEELGITTFFSR